ADTCSSAAISKLSDLPPPAAPPKKTSACGRSRKIRCRSVGRCGINPTRVERAGIARSLSNSWLLAASGSRFQSRDSVEFGLDKLINVTYWHFRRGIEAKNLGATFHYFQDTINCALVAAESGRPESSVQGIETRDFQLSHLVVWLDYGCLQRRHHRI